MTIVARTCSVQDCTGRYKARGLCDKHYQRALRGGDLPTNYVARLKRGCSVEGCQRRHYGAGFCNPHWQRAKQGRPIEGEIKALDPGRGCSAPNCERPHGQNGYCQAHNKRFKLGKDLSRPIQVRDPSRVCVVSGCEGKYFAVGGCSKHQALFRKYNITPIQYMLIQEQGCKICQSKTDLHIDHDHRCCKGHGESCGECIRGGLCPNCNVGLGMFGDSAERLERAAQYIRGMLE